MRTVRIDQKYRAVILHPDKGDVFVLVWVDNHNEAMDWAKNRTFEINPVTGSLQVFNVNEAEQAVVPPPKKKTTGLLDHFGDDLLLSFGIPAVLLPAVRGVRQPDDLLALNKHLPAECAEALMWLVEGLPPDEVRAAVGQPKNAQVDTGGLGEGSGTPGFSTPVRHHPVGQGFDGDSERSAGKVAGLSSPQPGKARHEGVQRPVLGFSEAQVRGRRLWPCTEPSTWPKGVHSEERPHSLHDIHGESGTERRGNAFDPLPRMQGSD